MKLDFGSDERSIAIREVVRAWEDEAGVEVLLAVEGGSRAHGFASPGSDHDVKLIYRQPMERAMSLFPERESMELKYGDLPFDPGFEMEMSGWSLQLALKLGLASNPLVSEYSRLPDIGRRHCAYLADQAFLHQFRKLGRAMVPRPALHNLRRMAKVNLKRELSREAPPKAKIYLQSGQAVLRAKWIALNHEKGWDFPLSIQDLITATPFPAEARVQMEELLTWKLSAEDSQHRCRYPLLDQWIAEEINWLENVAGQIPEEKIGREMVEDIWLSSYGLRGEAPAEPAPEMGAL